MTTAVLELHSVIGLHPLHIAEEGDGSVEVGRPDTGVFISLPVEGATVLNWLGEGVPLAEIESRFQAQYGLDFDAVDFVRDLSGCGFVATVDGRPLQDETAEQPAEVAPVGWRLFTDLPQRRMRWLLSPPAYLAYMAVWLALPVVLILEPGARPSGSAAFLGIGVLGNLVLLMAIGAVQMLLHEMAHLLAARARGCSGTLDISHRLHILVAQTDISSVRQLPRRERYAPYLAGMTWDATVLLLVTVLEAAGVGSGLLRAIGFVLVMSLVLEFALYLRTDLYYVLTNALRLGNLMFDTRRWLANVALRAIGRAARHDLSDIPPRELRVVRWYAGLVVVGVGATVGQFVLLGLPLLVKFVVHSSSGFRAGPATAVFWDSVGLVAVVVFEFGVLALGAVRERRRRRARAAAEVAGRGLVAG